MSGLEQLSTTVHGVERMKATVAAEFITSKSRLDGVFPVSAVSLDRVASINNTSSETRGGEQTSTRLTVI